VGLIQVDGTGTSGRAGPPAAASFREQLAAARDPDFIDAGLRGEVLVARVRLVLLLILLLIQAIPGAEPVNRQVTLPLTVTALVLGLLFYWLAVHVAQPWVGFLTSLTDVTLVSAGLAAFLALDAPHTAVNSRALFEVYFLALGCASLRYNWRVCAAAGAAAVLQYAAVVVAAAWGWDLDHPRYAPVRAGAFDWNIQGARFVLLAAMGVLSVFIVLRSQRLQQLSVTDRLTGVYNRAWFEQELTDEADRAHRHGRPYAIALIDIDHFKRFNDAHGHAGGDVALRTVAQVLRRGIRGSDAVARYGGEEFVLLMPEATAAGVVPRLEALRRAAEATPMPLGRRTRGAHVTISVGVASWPDAGGTADEVVRAADGRLYAAKRAGRNRVVGPPG
jgi:diguanylate cyclase (GGDEF)-like protein